MRIKFTIPGNPVGKGRPRFHRIGNYVQTYTPDATVAYENLIKLMYQQASKGYMFPEGTPLDMRLLIYYPIPKSVSKTKKAMMLSNQLRPLKKPDSSNVCKAVEDALNKIAYHDDTQIVDTQIRRYYSDNPRVDVVIQPAFIKEEE